jgi:hypothetical protein
MWLVRKCLIVLRFCKNVWPTERASLRTSAAIAQLPLQAVSVIDTINFTPVFDVLRFFIVNFCEFVSGMARRMQEFIKLGV